MKARSQAKIVSLHYQIDYWHLLFRMILLYGTVEEEKNKFMFKHTTQS